MCIRDRASADDRYSALDLAMDKLMERLRRRNDRRRVHRGHRTPESVAHATSRLEQAPAFTDEPSGATDTAASIDSEDRFGDSPIEVREKVHASPPMTLEQALHELELVGHDFYLFHDSETDRPSVVYRRRGWSYGVIHLDVADEPAEAEHDSSFDAVAVGAAAS